MMSPDLFSWWRTLHGVLLVRSTQKQQANKYTTQISSLSDVYMVYHYTMQ